MSSRPTSGRRPDTLFDNRYRIDHSYPRGRSGETRLAADTLNGDQPVIIKRPALQDATPMRAGQEQFILNEKRVLEKLTEHPAAPHVLNTGTFRVGGQAYQYIVLEVPQGASLEAMVRDFAAQSQQMPELEMYVLFDALLDAVHTIHEQKVAHNNLEPQHVYWASQ